MNEENPIKSDAESGDPAEPADEQPRAIERNVEPTATGALFDDPGEALERAHESYGEPSPGPPFSAVTEAERAYLPETRLEPWRGRDLALFVGFSVIWTFLSGVLLLSGYAILRPLMGWKTPTSALVDNTFFGLLVQLVLYAPVLLYIFLLVTVHYRLPFWAGVSWRWPEGRGAVRFFFGGVLLAFAVFAGSALVPDRRHFPLEKMFSSPSAAYALGAFAVLVAPFMEELIFRGVLFAFFEHLTGLRWAVVITALLFAALHYPEYEGAWTHLGMILLVGVVFSLARALTGSLAPSFLLHTAYNGTFMFALFLGTHHFRNLQALGSGG